MKYSKFCKQYFIADGWINGNITKYQQKLNGRRSTDFKFLYPYLECSTCAFPHTHTPIDSHNNVCTTTQMSGLMVTLSLPLHHWCVTIIIPQFQELNLMKSGQNVPQLTHVTFPNSHMTINDYKALPSSIKCIVAVMHTNQNSAVMEITIDTQTIKIFD
jgi:hypothetical protein